MRRMRCSLSPARVLSVGMLGCCLWYTLSHGSASETSSIKAEVGVPCCECHYCRGDGGNAIRNFRLRFHTPGDTPQLAHRDGSLGLVARFRPTSGRPVEPLSNLLPLYTGRTAIGIVSAVPIQQLSHSDVNPTLVPSASLCIGNGMAVPSRQATSARSLPRLRLRPDREHDRPMSGVRAGHVAISAPIRWYTPSHGSASETPSIQAEVGVPRWERHNCCGNGGDAVCQSLMDLHVSGDTSHGCCHQRVNFSGAHTRRGTGGCTVRPRVAQVHLEVGPAVQQLEWSLARSRPAPLVSFAPHCIDNGVAVPSRQATSTWSLPRLRVRPDREHDRAMSGVRTGHVGITSPVRWYTESHGSTSETPSFQTEVGVPCREPRDCCRDGYHAVRHYLLECRARETGIFWRDPEWMLRDLVSRSFPRDVHLELQSYPDYVGVVASLSHQHEAGCSTLVPLSSLCSDDGVALLSRQATSTRPLPELRLRHDREHDRPMSGVRAGRSKNSPVAQTSLRLSHSVGRTAPQEPTT